MMYRFARLLSFALVTTAPVAAMTDPPAPPGGFTVATSTYTITFSDGHQAPLDLYLPMIAPPATGWPGVLVMHGGGGDRRIPDVVAICRTLAAAGYAAYAYDGRSVATQERDFVDSAEAHGLAQAVAGAGQIDPNRLAATGISGGGRKSFAAAAWSGLPLPSLGYPALVADYPPVLAVAAEITPLDSTRESVLGGVVVADHLVQGKSSTHPWIQAIAAGDFAGLVTQIDTQFNRDLVGQLGTSGIPILSMVAMQDFKIFNNPAIDVFLSASAGPRRFFPSTGGHSTVKNGMERAMMQDLRRRWFDHFLKGIQNGVDNEPFAEVAMQPGNTAAHLNTGSTWEHRQEDQWPPAIPASRMHLQAGNALSRTPPTAVAVGPTLLHRVGGGIDINQYIAAGAGLNPVWVTSTGVMPEIVVSFDGAPLLAPREILGRPVVELSVDDTTGVFQLTAVLSHVDPGGVEHWITAGTMGCRSAVPGPATLRIEMADVAHVVPQGHQLRLSIQNLADINGPGSRRIRYVPYFSNTDTTIRIDPAAPSWLDLPMRPYQSDLLPRLARASAAGPIAHTMQLRAGPRRAGQPYVAIMGCSGEGAGTPFAGLTLPIVVDACTTSGLLALNTPALPNTFGVLNAAGTALPGFALPAALAPAVLGARLSFAGVVFDAGGVVDIASGPATLEIVP
ncbi:MAG: CocE/NonD family hydrolase C-terminal non-catalytic domain-containing protein [Planctomycetota bacterium]